MVFRIQRLRRRSAPAGVHPSSIARPSRLRLRPLDVLRTRNRNRRPRSGAVIPELAAESASVWFSGISRTAGGHPRPGPDDARAAGRDHRPAQSGSGWATLFARLPPCNVFAIGVGVPRSTNAPFDAPPSFSSNRLWFSSGEASRHRNDRPVSRARDHRRETPRVRHDARKPFRRPESDARAGERPPPRKVFKLKTRRGRHNTPIMHAPRRVMAANSASVRRFRGRCKTVDSARVRVKSAVSRPSPETRFASAPRIVFR